MVKLGREGHWAGAIIRYCAIVYWELLVCTVETPESTHKIISHTYMRWKRPVGSTATQFYEAVFLPFTEDGQLRVPLDQPFAHISPFLRHSRPTDDLGLGAEAWARALCQACACAYMYTVPSAWQALCTFCGEDCFLHACK